MSYITVVCHQMKLNRNMNLSHGKSLHINDMRSEREGRAVSVYVCVSANRVLHRECREREKFLTESKKKDGRWELLFSFETASLTADDCNIMERKRGRDLRTEIQLHPGIKIGEPNQIRVRM